MERPDSFSTYPQTIIIQHTTMSITQGEIGPEAQKKLHQIIATAETFLSDLSVAKDTELPEFYAKIASSNNKELQRDVGKVLQAVAMLLQKSEDDLLVNYFGYSDDIIEIPSALRKKKEDENLIAESNHYVKQLDSITNCFNFLIPCIENEINRIKSPYKLEFTIFKKPIEIYHAFYRKHYTLLDKISNSIQPLIDKLANRIKESQNQHILSNGSRDILSYAHAIEPTKAKVTLSNFEMQTKLIIIKHEEVITHQQKLDYLYQRFKLKCNYFMHLCAFQKRSHLGYFSSFFMPYYPKWYNYLALETLHFSDNLLVDMQYRQNSISKNLYLPPVSNDQVNTSAIACTSTSTDKGCEDVSINHARLSESQKHEELVSVSFSETSFSSSDDEAPRNGKKKKSHTDADNSLSEDYFSCLGGNF